MGSTPWSEVELVYLLSLVPAQMVAWARWDYIAACMLHRFGPTRLYNAPVVRAQFMQLRDRWRYDIDPNPYFFHPEPFPSNTAPSAAPRAGLSSYLPLSPPPTNDTEEPGDRGSSKVRILGRIGSRMEYCFVPQERLLNGTAVPPSGLEHPELEPIMTAADPTMEATAAPTKIGVGAVPGEDTGTAAGSPNNGVVSDAHPTIFRRNYTKWSADEESFLDEIVRESPQDWDLIVRRMQMRFPHGRNYTVGSLKKKVQYVPVCRPGAVAAERDWSKRPRANSDSSAGPDPGFQTAVPFRNGPDSGTLPICDTDRPHAFVATNNTGSIRSPFPPADLPSAWNLDIVPGAAKSVPPPSLPPLPFPYRQPAEVPPFSDSESESAYGNDNDRLLGQAIARIVQTLGLDDNTVSNMLLSSIPFAEGNGADGLPHKVGGCGGTYSSPRRDEFKTERGGDMAAPAAAGPIRPAPSRRPPTNGTELTEHGTISDQSTWRRWLHKLTTLKTALGVP